MKQKHQIIFNGRFLTRRMTGVDRFAYELLLAIDVLRTVSQDFADLYDIEIFVPKNSVINYPDFKTFALKRVGPGSGVFWEQVTLPLHSKGKYLVNLCNIAPIFYKNKLVVIHDLATFYVPYSYSRLFRIWYRILMPLLYRYSLDIATVSRFSMSQMHSRFGQRSLGIISEGSDHMNGVVSSDRVLENLGLNSSDYVLCVGSLVPHKNLQIFTEIIPELQSLGLTLVVVGAQANIFSDSVFKDIGKGIKFTGYVTDQELKSLYKSAFCFVFPSFYEGYGLPPIEAMACGCPVLASNYAAIPEVCGDGALYFDPNNPKELLNLLRLLVEDPDLRLKRKSISIKHSSTLSWRIGAEQLLDLINRRLR